MTKKKDLFLRVPLQTVTGEAATLLTRHRSARALAPFLSQPCGMTDAAAQLGTSTQALRYWVRRYLETGLLREVVAGGRVYLATAEVFLVALDDWSAKSFEELQLVRNEAFGDRFDDGLRRALLESFPECWGVRVSAGREPGQLAVQVCSAQGDVPSLEALVRRADAPAVLSCWVTLKLSFFEAKAFQGELAALLVKYAECRGEDTYLAQVGLTPD